MKTQFNEELPKLRNGSSNNPLSTLERYQRTVELIMGGKMKLYSERNEQEISLLKTYNVVSFDSQMKLVEKMNLLFSSMWQ